MVVQPIFFITAKLRLRLYRFLFIDVNQVVDFKTI